MAKGYSLHIGINHANDIHYKSPLKLKWCENDAEAMFQLATVSGYKATKILNESATTEHFLSYINEKAVQLVPGDIFLLTFSGHGALCADTNMDERDYMDEAWVFYDRMLLDDEAQVCWSKFKPGVRVVIVSDCCYSGALLDHYVYGQSVHPPADNRSRFVSSNEASRIIHDNQECYLNVLRSLPDIKPLQIQASVLQLTACRKNELALEYDYYEHGVFTYTLLEVWKNCHFTNYHNFLMVIAATIRRTTQHPDVITEGMGNLIFQYQKPFEI
jgi:metacaspase-1